jgi:hypothetical protein
MSSPLLLIAALAAGAAAPSSAASNPAASRPAAAPASVRAVSDAVIARLSDELAATYGAAERPRIERGIRQAAGFWRAEDGDEAAFEAVVREQLAPDAAARDALFTRMEFVLESFDGHMNEIGRDFSRQTDLDLGPILPVDEILGGYSPGAHFVDDSFENRLAFSVLLNFPLSTLDDRLKNGESWSRRQWAEARLADRFSKRVPASVSLDIAEAGAEADRYIGGYNIWMHHLVDAKGARLFAP